MNIQKLQDILMDKFRKRADSMLVEIAVELSKNIKFD